MANVSLGVIQKITFAHSVFFRDTLYNVTFKRVKILINSYTYYVYYKFSTTRTTFCTSFVIVNKYSNCTCNHFPEFLVE